MGARYEHYRWWLLDGDLEIVSDGKVAGASLLAALADLNRQIDRLSDRGQHPTNQPYKLIVYKGASVVAYVDVRGVQLATGSIPGGPDDWKS